MFRGLLLSEFSKRPLREVYYKANDFSGHHIADPFMGGGTPILEANRVGCDVTGFDINPMSYWIVKQEIEHLNLDDYSEAARLLRSTLEKEIGHFYRTRCTFCGSRDAILFCFHLFFLTRCQAFRLQYVWFFTRGLAETIFLQLAHLIIGFMVFFTIKTKTYIWSIAEELYIGRK